MKRALVLLFGLASMGWAQETLKLQITVEGAEKKPVPGAEVWIWEATIPGLPTLVGSGKSDADGRVQATAPIRPTHQLARYQALARLGDQTAIAHLFSEKPAAGQELAATATLGPATTARVRVIGPDGKPAPGLHLRVARLFHPKPEVQHHRTPGNRGPLDGRD